MADRTITKAVIPIAGLGKRMGPLCRAVPKAMLPLVGADGRLRPIIDHILLGVAAAGLRRAALIVAPQHAEVLNRYFAAPGDDDWPRPDVGIELIVQPQPRGLGDAALLAEGFAAGEPVALLLGDHVHLPAPGGRACAAQVTEAFSARGAAAMVGMQVVGPGELPSVGAARGEPVGDEVYLCREIIEKPDLATARRRLLTPGLPPDRFLAHAGIYAFSPEIFHCLRDLSARSRPPGEELQLTAAQALLLTRRPEECFLLRLAGQCLDTGTPSAWLAAQQALLGGARG